MHYGGGEWDACVGSVGVKDSCLRHEKERVRWDAIKCFAHFTKEPESSAEEDSERRTGNVNADLCSRGASLNPRTFLLATGICFFMRP